MHIKHTQKETFSIVSQWSVSIRWLKTIKMLSSTQCPDSYWAVIIRSWSHFHALLESILLWLKTTVKCQSMPCHYCLIFGLWDTHRLRFSFSVHFLLRSYYHRSGGHVIACNPQLILLECEKVSRHLAICPDTYDVCESKQKRNLMWGSTTFIPR